MLGTSQKPTRKTLRRYLHAHDKGGLRWAGGAWTYCGIPAGLGEDVYCLRGEPTGATIAFFKDFASQCHDATEAAGFPRTLCSYMRNYWGSILLDKYILADGTVVDGYPTPDFIWQDHVCCSHSKWYQVVSDLEGGIPTYSIDVSVGPFCELNENRLEYIVGQMHDGIEWLEKVTGRRYDDEN
jgi:benzoyl-CoA reductase subunit B